MTIWCKSDIIPELSAAIAQPVERILGKDEVASSNLASSSKSTRNQMVSGTFLHFIGICNITVLLSGRELCWNGYTNGYTGEFESQ